MVVDLVNWLYVLVSLAVVLVYLPASIRRLVTVRRDWHYYRRADDADRRQAVEYMGTSCLTVGILCSFLGNGMHRSWWQVWREARDRGWTEMADWMATADLQAFAAALVILGGCLHLAVALWRVGRPALLGLLAFLLLAAAVLAHLF